MSCFVLDVSKTYGMLSHDSLFILDATWASRWYESLVLDVSKTDATSSRGGVAAHLPASTPCLSPSGWSQLRGKWSAVEQ